MSDLKPVFVLTRPDDETLNLSIEFAPGTGEDITTVGPDDTRPGGHDMQDLLAGTVKSIGDALGIEVVER